MVGFFSLLILRVCKYFLIHLKYDWQMNFPQDEVIVGKEDILLQLKCKLPWKWGELSNLLEETRRKYRPLPEHETVSQLLCSSKGIWMVLWSLTCVSTNSVAIAPDALSASLWPTTCLYTPLGIILSGRKMGSTAGDKRYVLLLEYMA